MQTALVAGGLLAFAPLLRRDHRHHVHRSAPASRPCRSGSSRNLSRPNQLPIVNVVAVLVILISIIPVYLAHQLTRDEGGAAPDRRPRDHGDGRGDRGAVDNPGRMLRFASAWPACAS